MAFSTVRQAASSRLMLWLTVYIQIAMDLHRLTRSNIMPLITNSSAAAPDSHDVSCP